jgi:hypothetical protein
MAKAPTFEVRGDDIPCTCWVSDDGYKGSSRSGGCDWGIFTLRLTLQVTSSGEAVRGFAGIAWTRLPCHQFLQLPYPRVIIPEPPLKMTEKPCPLFTLHLHHGEVEIRLVFRDDVSRRLVEKLDVRTYIRNARRGSPAELIPGAQRHQTSSTGLPMNSP